jgi:hypothetical protein
MRRALVVGLAGGVVLGLVLASVAAVNPEPNENERAFGWFMGRALVAAAFVSMVCGVLVRTASEGIVAGASMVAVGMVVVVLSAIVRALAGAISIEDELVPTVILAPLIGLVLLFPGIGGALLGSAVRSLLSKAPSRSE